MVDAIHFDELDVVVLVHELNAARYRFDHSFVFLIRGSEKFLELSSSGKLFLLITPILDIIE